MLARSFQNIICDAVDFCSFVAGFIAKGFILKFGDQ